MVVLSYWELKLSLLDFGCFWGFSEAVVEVRFRGWKSISHEPALEQVLVMIGVPRQGLAGLR